MSLSKVDGFRIAGVSTCVPARAVDNIELGKDFGADEVRKVVAMAGVQQRRVVDPGTNRFWSNRYSGSWRFDLRSPGQTLTGEAWRGTGQDAA